MTASERSAEKPPFEKKSVLRAVMSPSSVNPTLYRRALVRMPLACDREILVATENDAEPGGGDGSRPEAAKIAGWAACVSLPPKPPPIRLQTQTTWACRMPSARATTV